MWSLLRLGCLFLGGYVEQTGRRRILAIQEFLSTLGECRQCRRSMVVGDTRCLAYTDRHEFERGRNSGHQIVMAKCVIDIFPSNINVGITEETRFMYIEDTNIDMSIIDTHAPIDIFWEVITGCYPIRGESGS